MKEITSLALDITEKEYREDPALSYSTLAKFDRSGFNGLETLFDRVESSSLTFGSAVDTILTEGYDEFNRRFYVNTIPNPTEAIMQIMDRLFEMYGTVVFNPYEISQDAILNVINECGYQPNWKAETRVKVILEKGAEYYKLLYQTADKTIIDQETYNSVIASVNAIKSNPLTSQYFNSDDAQFGDVKIYHQLKFKAKLRDDIEYRCMFDSLQVDYKNKTIQPIDLKTSYAKEWDFYHSFVKWGYQIQVRLYTRILEEVLKNDEDFKDFKVLDFKDVVVCKDSLKPLVWDIPFSHAFGNIITGKNNQIVMRDPEYIGKELTKYLNEKPEVPIGIEVDKSNDLLYYLKNLE